MNASFRNIFVIFILTSGYFMLSARQEEMIAFNGGQKAALQTSHLFPVGCAYADFFSQVMKYHSGIIKTLPAGDCFRVRTYDEPEYFETDKARYRLSITFYCQYGYSGTENGVSCYGELLCVFISWLKGRGYVVKKTEDLSMSGWGKTLYRATSEKESFLFVYESESAASMGYAKIRLLKLN